MAKATVHPARDAEQIGRLLDLPEVRQLIVRLDALRWTGRAGYGARAMVGMALAKSLYCIPVWTRVVALVRDHAALRDVIGAAPSEWACYRFAKKLRAHPDALADCLDAVVERLRAEVPGYGDALAIDGSDLPAYANGQKHVFPSGSTSRPAARRGSARPPTSAARATRRAARSTGRRCRSSRPHHRRRAVLVAAQDEHRGPSHDVRRGPLARGPKGNGQGAGYPLHVGPYPRETIFVYGGASFVVSVAVPLASAAVLAAVVVGVVYHRAARAGRPPAPPATHAAPAVPHRVRLIAETIQHWGMILATPGTVVVAVQHYRRDHIVPLDVAAVVIALVALVVVTVLSVRARCRRVVPLRVRQGAFAVAFVAAIAAIGTATVSARDCDTAKPQAEPPIRDIAVEGGPSHGAVSSANPGVIRRHGETPPIPRPDREPEPSGDEGVGEEVVAGCFAERGN